MENGPFENLFPIENVVHISQMVYPIVYKVYISQVMQDFGHQQYHFTSFHPRIILK